MLPSLLDMPSSIVEMNLPALRRFCCMSGWMCEPPLYCTWSHEACIRKQAAYEVLNVLDFTSERARMSIIVRAPDGTLRLHCKGSDSALLTRLRQDMDTSIMDQTHTNLHNFSVKVLSVIISGSVEWPMHPNASHHGIAARIPRP